jgi:hypothetical protein
MTTQNMQKLLDLLKSMTPENMGLILSALNDIITDDNKHPSAPSSIGELLDDHLKLVEKSMSKLLDFYSFIEFKKMEKPGNTYYEIISHKYKDGKTPFLKNLSFGNEQPPTCSAISVLDKGLRLVAHYFRMAFNVKKGVDFEFRNRWDTKLLESQTKCKTQGLITGGGRKRKTLKKKRGSYTRRKRMVK